MLPNWNDAPTANPHASGTTKLEKRQFDDQLAQAVLARRASVKHGCSKTRILNPEN